MKKIKILLSLVALLALMPVLFVFMDQAIRAASTPSFSLYEKVHLANNTYTVIGTDGTNVKLLMDTTIGNAQTWANANTTATNFPSSTNVGVLGNEVLKNKYSLPLSTDLSPITASNTLNSGVPTITSDWWLGDASVNNRSKFMTKDNKNNGTKTLVTTTQDQTTGACGTSTKNETGVMVTNTKKEEVDKTANIWVKREAVMIGNVSASYPKAYTYTTTDCTGSPAIGALTQMDGTGVPISIDEHGNLFTGAGTGRSWVRIAIQNIPDFNTTFKSGVQGSQYSFNLTPDICYSMASTTGSAVSLKMPTGYPLTITLTMKNAPSDTTDNRTCTGQTYNAGTALTRPMSTIPISDIISANTTKRTYTPGNTLSGSFPSSDSGSNKPYVTLKNTNLKVALTNGANGVSGTTLNTTLPSDHILKIPVTLTGNKEGAQFVSASANIGGAPKYGVLKQVTANNDIVEVDLRDFASDPSTLTQISLILYHENEGSYQTSYMGEGTEITVNLLSPQEIAFDASNPTTAEYGSLTKLSASLTTPLNKQSNEPIKFSIVSGSATIDSQSYVASTGIATANILPTSGTGTVVIAIDKAGDTSASAATQQTITLTLGKKAITVKPTRFNKTYIVNENMPVLTSTSDGLISGDTLPSVLVPVLEPLNGSAQSPSTGGVITSVGTWKQVYSSTILNGLPSSFTDKYNITLEDYDDDNTYVFMTSLTAIPDGWLIVTPNANSDGWNNTDVTVSLSQAAQNMGYHTIEAVNANGDVIKYGSTLLYSTETSAEVPKVRIKGDTHTSDPVDLRTLKIDKTKPVINTVTIDKETDWAIGKKQISVNASDALSGIKEITATCNGSTYTATLNGSVYTFDADQNGTYAIVVSDMAGNAETISKPVSMITAPSITLTATPESLITQKPKQKITINRDPGDSGIKSFNVYYEQSGTFVLLEALDHTQTTFDWYAEMNGKFRFTLENNAGESKSVDVTITMVNPPVPVTQIEAVYKADPTKAYTSGAWVNEDIVLNLKNANADVTDPVVWEYSTDGTTWTTLSDNPMTVSVNQGDYLNQTYMFKAKVDKGGVNDIFEQSPKSFTVRIDKTAPDVPEITDASNYTQNNWYASAQTITAKVNNKASGASQNIYVCEGSKSDCEGDPSKWTMTTNGEAGISGNGSHELYFKTIDEAGNESAFSSVIYVNINNTAPEITISINENPIKSLINNLTFGFFYQNKVDISIEANYTPTGNQSNAGQSGTIYYIIDEAGGGVPADNDPAWVEGTSFSLNPEIKAMIYVKAVSSAGIIGRESSVYNIYVDNVGPSMSAVASASWTNDDTFTVEITDQTSGVDAKSVNYSVDGDPAVLGNYSDPNVSITGLKEGEYDLVINANDYSGNTTSKTYHVRIDTTIPVISIPTPDINGWAKEKTITFTPRDVLSGIDEVSVKQSDGSEVAITKQADGSYSFQTTEHDTYTITVSDVAGNQATTTYSESMIDTTGPQIDHIVISDEQAWKSSKTVTFDVIDPDSGIADVRVECNGKAVHVNTPVSGNEYNFTAQASGTYTITAIDAAGNTTTETVTVNNISQAGIRITNLSDTSTWVKDTMNVQFDVEPGDSGLKPNSVTVVYNQTPITVKQTNGHYEFTATSNGSYTISAENNAGDTATETITISRIDVFPPVIENISNNTTSTEYREPQKISFHVRDHNDSQKTTTGSGIKTGYPKVYYNKNGNRIEVPLTQDSNDSTQYTFLADRNTTYTVEVMDVVEHTMVTKEIIVDHIFDQDKLTPLVVKAYNGVTLISSGTWVRNSIRFEISGGLETKMLEKYQVAVTDGTKPIETDWHDVNKGTNEHELTGNIKGDVYWFRAVPVMKQATISSPFTVNLDNTPPTSLIVKKRSIHTDPISRLINVLSFGGWMSEAQEVSFDAEDNFTDKEAITYMYYEERDGEKGNWKRYGGPLTYNDTNITLHVKAIDLAGNETAELPEEVKIDSVPPVISGVQSEKEYKYYYLPRLVTVSDAPSGAQSEGSGVAIATYKKDDGHTVEFNKEVSLSQIGTYFIHVEDRAGNVSELTFKIVPLPDLKDIDGSDESKAIIDQVKKELEEIRDHIDTNEAENYDKWIDDATKKWESLRKNQLIHEDTTTKVEGVGNTTFDPNTELVVEEVRENNLPELPHQLIKAFDVYLRKNGNKVQANGKIKVYLPYDGVDDVILYGIDTDGDIKEISYHKEAGYLVFETDELEAYALTMKEKQVNPKPTPDPKPDPEEPKDDTINIDTDQDGKPDINIDINCDGKLSNNTDLNIDTDGDNIPDINIDTTGDGKANYNIDIDGDGLPDVNIGPVVWKTDKCSTTNCGQAYCTSTYYKPYLNIDTDQDGLPDINLDLNNDDEPDLNIDIDEDGIPDIDIDSVGDGMPHINIDTTGDGWPNKNLVIMKEWKPNDNIKGVITYDTMLGLKADEALTPDTWKPSGGGTIKKTTTTPTTSVKGSYTSNAIGGANTADEHSLIQLWIFVLLTGGISLTIHTIQKRRMHKR